MIVLPFGIITPLPTIFAVKLVYVPVRDKVNDSKFNVVAARVKAVVPKSNLLNQLLLVNVAIAVPDPVNVKLGALVAEPSTVPKVYVLVISAAAVNPPVPVQVKLVAVAIDKLVEPAVLVDNKILFVPNSIERVLALVELNVPVVRLNPFNVNVPAVSV